MSNIFKSNSRFSVLAEENFKSNDRVNNNIAKPNNNTFKKNVRNVNNLTINETNFPELVTEKKKENDNTSYTISYANKLNTEEIVEVPNSDPDLEGLDYGWVVFKRENGKNIVKRDLLEVEKEKNNEWAKEVVESLVSLHERRTQEYIDLYGYDNWEKRFKYPGWQEAEAFFDQEDDEEDIDEDDEEDIDEDY